MDPQYLKELQSAWVTEFDWRERRAELNAMPQHIVRLDGMAVHYVHVRGNGPSPFPLLLGHGWPGTFIEMERLIPILTDPASHGGDARDAFDVVVPSLPGVTYSDPLPETAGLTEIASLWSVLMRDVLGYTRYGAHGGDIGANVATRMASLDSAVAALHLTWVAGSSVIRSSGEGEPAQTPAEQAFLRKFAQWGEREGAYAHLQRTKSHAIAAALNDSPMGIAAWLADKYRSWSDCGGNVRTRFTDRDVITIATMYWLTESIGSSMELYQRCAEHPWHLQSGERVRVPTAVALVHDGIPHPPREWGERVYNNITRWTVLPSGGHFAAHEEPQFLAENIRDHFRPIRRNVVTEEPL